MVLIDLTPEALIQRLRAGKVYPGERIEAALNNFFKIENLAALREVALRQVAEEVEAKRLVFEAARSRDDDAELLESAAPQAVGERLLALVKPRAKSQRVVRRAWRSAQRLRAELDILWVSPHEPDEAGARAARRAAAAGHRARRASAGRARRRRRRDRPPRRRRARHDLRADGTPQPRSALRRLRAPALPFRLLQRASGRRPAHRRRSQPPQHRGPAMTILVLAIAVLVVCLAVLGGLGRRDRRRRERARGRSAGGSCSRSSGARSRGARSTRHCASPAPTARRSCPSSWRACRCTCRSTRRCRASARRACRCWRRSSSAPASAACLSTRASSAAAPIATRCARRSTHERYDRLVVAAASARSDGFNGEDVAWLLDHAPGEVSSSARAATTDLNGHGRELARTTLVSDGPTSRRQARIARAAG